MKRNTYSLSFFIIIMLLPGCSQNKLDFSKYPSTIIANEHIQMKVYMPDKENGMYRSTRFDWSGVIESVQYQGHEYFGYWKATHDPLFHEDLCGPVESYVDAGLGYNEAETGEGFVRIGVGVVQKVKEKAYRWNGNYSILDHGEWLTEQGPDWISFEHKLETDFGYAYTYNKVLRLLENGFLIEHKLQNRGKKAIVSDQFNHNFFMIDKEQSGPNMKIIFPWEIRTEDDPKGFMELKGNELHFLEKLELDSVKLTLKGYSEELEDHRVTVINTRTGAGVSYSVDKALTNMFFWACKTTLSPENSIQLSVSPGQTEEWTSSYTLFVEEPGK